MRAILAILLFSCSLACATPMFFGLNNTSVGGGGGSSAFTCSGTCWAEVDCTSPSQCGATSSTQTITGSGTLKFNGGYSHVVQYSDNGGTLTAIADGGTISWTSGHTLAIRITQMAAGNDGDTVTVTDNSGGGVVGTFSAMNTHA